MIKPSSPTPPHLRKHRLSLLDQIAPPVYFHFILYFSPSDHLTHDSAKTSETLKRSMSDALAIYYPLAGRLRQDDSVHCNDAGAEYVEATFNDVRILDVVQNARPEEIKQFVPAAPSGGRDIPLAVQVSFFGCSGISIGVCVSHKLADAKTAVAFLNTWAAACRGDSETVAAAQPSFNMAFRFPPMEFPSFIPGPDENVVTRRFTFDAERMEALRAAASGPLLEKPSRVEAVSAFIWRQFIEAAEVKDKMKGSGSVKRGYAAVHAVDLRGRANPPLPSDSFGNGTAGVMTTATATEEEGEISYYRLAVKLREAITGADGDFVRKYEDGSVFGKHQEKEAAAPAFMETQICVFSSWWRFAAYEADYGWGKPAWVSNVAVPVKNLVVFFGTKSGDGIEAWVTMAADDVDFIHLAS